MSSLRGGLVLSTVLALAVAGPVAGQTCERGKQLRPNLGIRTFHCTGGSCMVSGARSTTGSGFPDAFDVVRQANRKAFAFTVEPRLWEIDPGGPAAGRVEEGDALLAVDGDPITTAAGWKHLTEMREGEPVTLTLRRDGRLVEAVVEPRLTCHNYMASAGQNDIPAYLARRRGAGTRRDALLEGRAILLEEGRLAIEGPSTAIHRTAPVTRLEGIGLVLVGPKEVRVDADGRTTWWFREIPTVATVLPGSPAEEAGIRPGERIVTAGGARVTGTEGTRALAAAGRRGSVTVRVRRGATEREVTIHGG